MTTTVHHFSKGDKAMTLGFPAVDGFSGVDPEEVEILGGRMVTVGIRETERQERWLRVRFDSDGHDGLLIHPSSLTPIRPLADVLAAYPVGGSK